MNLEPEIAVQSDSPWKEVLDEFFPDFTQMLFPELYAGVDWKKGFTPLDKEFQSLGPGSSGRGGQGGKKGELTVDKLMRVHSLRGKSMLVLVHIEIQARKQTGFARRMFLYHARIFAKYRQPVVSLAVLADTDRTWRPSVYEHGFGGCRLRLDFPIVKLLDYKGRDAELAASSNRFAIVVFAYLKAQESEHNEGLRFEWKLELTKRLSTRSVDEQARLMRFFDWVFPLSDDREDEFWSTLRTTEEGKSMAYVTSLERISIRKGREQGLEEGLEQGRLHTARESVLEALEARFGTVPMAVKEAVNSISSVDDCKRLHVDAIRAESMDAFVGKLGV